MSVELCTIAWVVWDFKNAFRSLVRVLDLSIVSFIVIRYRANTDSRCIAGIMLIGTSSKTGVCERDMRTSERANERTISLSLSLFLSLSGGPASSRARDWLVVAKRRTSLRPPPPLSARQISAQPHSLALVSGGRMRCAQSR